MWICAVIYDVVVCGFVKVAWGLLEVADAFEGFSLP